MALRSIKNPILKDTAIVALFWWATFSYLDISANGFDETILADMQMTLLFAACGILIGIAYSAYSIHGFRRKQALGLVQGSLRGLYSRIGAVPRLLPPPKQARIIPALLPYPPEIPAGFIEHWYEKYRTSHPAHFRLMLALLKVHTEDMKAPATHLEGGHGGRTLFQHSLLVTGLCLQLSSSWEYAGLKGKSGRTIVPLRNPSYQFDKNDPLIAILGIAHDIGKMECYVRDENGSVIGSRYEHDQVGARMLGRMDEVWDLPDIDREALITAVNYYHHPMDTPMDNGGVPFEDRAIAIMELLIKADTIASRLENGQTMDESEQCDAPQAEDVKKRIWDGFIELLTQSGRINGPDVKYRIGQKNNDETGHAMVYLHEASLRETLARQLNLDGAARMGDNTYVLTRGLLKVLEEKGVLYQQHEGALYSDSRAIFVVDFYSAKKKDERIAGWPAAIIIKPGTLIPALTNMPDFSSIPRIVRARFGDHSAKGKETSILDATPTESADGLFEIPPGTKQQKKNKPSKKVAEPAEELPPTVATPDPVKTSESPVACVASGNIEDIPDPNMAPGEDLAEDVTDLPDPNAPPDEDYPDGDPDDQEMVATMGTLDDFEPEPPAPETPPAVPSPPPTPVAKPAPTAPAAEAPPKPVPPPAERVKAEQGRPAIKTEPVTPTGLPMPSPEIQAKAARKIKAIVQAAKANAIPSKDLTDGRLVIRWDHITATDPNFRWEGLHAAIKSGGIADATLSYQGTQEFLVITGALRKG